MSSFSSFLLNPYFPFIRTLFFGVILATLFVFYLEPRGRDEKNISRSRTLIKISIIFRLFYPLLLSTGQWYLWSEGTFQSLFLTLPLDPLVPLPFSLPPPSFSSGYFAYYVFGRFWLEELLTIASAFLLYYFLKRLKAHNKRFLEKREVMLGLLAPLVVGWPNLIIFILFFVLLMVGFSLFRLLWFKQSYTQFGVPLLFALLITFLGGNWLIELFHLTVLII